MATTATLTENSRQGINSEKPPCVGPEAWLSPTLQPGCGHAYDETPVGLVVYVRNDPVNLIDPDGRLAADPNGNGPWYLWWDWDSLGPTGIITGGEGNIIGLNIGLSTEPGSDLADPVGSDPSSGGGSGALQQTLQGLLNNQGALLSGIFDRLFKDNGRCRDFINAVIGYLSPHLTSDFTIGKLIINILSADRNIDSADPSAHTVGNSINLPTNANTTRGLNDLWSTLIHEGLHLAMNTNNGTQLKDGDIITAVANAAFGKGYSIPRGDRIVPTRFNSEIIGQNCGPGTPGTSTHR